jgi:hypothetical protein
MDRQSNIRPRFSLALKKFVSIAVLDQAMTAEIRLLPSGRRRKMLRRQSSVLC